MAKPRPTRAEIAKAFNRRCFFTCQTCGRPCKFSGGYAHRLDCCGRVVVHLLDSTLTPRILSNPTAIGYLTGASRTKRKAS